MAEREVVGTMTCGDCLEVFTLYEDETPGNFEEMLSAHLAGHVLEPLSDHDRPDHDPWGTGLLDGGR
jgi:hypothetical protein